MCSLRIVWRALVWTSFLVLAFARLGYGDTAVPLGASQAQTLKVSTSFASLIDAYATNNTGNTVFLYVFNSATIPVNGTVTAGTASGNFQDCVAVPTGESVSIFSAGAPAEYFGSGVYLAASSTSCGTLTLTTTDFLHARTQ